MEVPFLFFFFVPFSWLAPPGQKPCRHPCRISAVIIINKKIISKMISKMSVYNVMLYIIRCILDVGRGGIHISRLKFFFWERVFDKFSKRV